MRWIRYSTEGRTAYGILDGDRITEVTGDPFDGYERPAKHVEDDITDGQCLAHGAAEGFRRRYVCTGNR